MTVIALVALIGLAADLIWAAIESAGVTADWNWNLCAIGVVAAFYYLFRSSLAVSPARRTPGILLVLIVLAAGIQLIPLPLQIVAVLSPARVQLARATAAGLGIAQPSATLSIAPQATVQLVLTLAGYALVFLVIRDLTASLRERRYAWATVWPLLLLGAAEGVLGFFQTYGENAAGFARGTYVSRDHYAGLLELILPFAVIYPFAILYRHRRRHESPGLPAIRACVVLAGAAVTLVAIVLSLSRMAFLASLASLLVGATLALGFRDRSVSAIGSPWRRWMPVAFVGVLVTLAFFLLPTDSLIARFSDLATTESISADTRAQIWQQSVGIVKAYPIFGCGWGGYESAFLSFKTVAPMNTVDYAHNDYLQVLAEAGLIGFVPGMLLLLFVLRSGMRGVTRAGSLDEQLLASSAMAALAAILLHSFVDFNMYVPANGMALAWIAGIAASWL